MSANGTAVRAAIMARLSGIAGGRITRGTPDHDGHARAADGAPRPYIGVLFGAPYPMEYERSIEGSDGTTPHMMTFTVTAYSGNWEDTEATIAAAKTLLRDWQPTAGSTPCRGRGGFSGDNADPAKSPTRFDEAAFFQTIINQGPDLA